MIIRTVRDSDFPALIWNGMEEWAEQIYKEFEESKTGRFVYLVAEENSEPIGQVLVHEVGPREKPYLQALRVRDDFQGRGIGTTLITAGEQLLRECGKEIVTLTVGKDNPRAKALYEKVGYVVLREFVDRGVIVKNGVEEEYAWEMWEMEKKLS